MQCPSSLGEDGLIVWEGRIDGLTPRIDPALEALHTGKAETTQENYGIITAHAIVTIHDDRLGRVGGATPRRKFVQRDQQSPLQMNEPVLPPPSNIYEQNITG
jgi:hypothetical protein